MDEPSDKERAFIEAYLSCWNGAEAARQAKYPVKSARQIAHRLLTKAYIRAEIEKRLADAAMGANEVLARLSDLASGSLEDCITLRGKKWVIDLPKAKRLGKLHLVKSIRSTRYGPEIELHDAQAALEKLGRHWKLFTDKLEVDDSGLTDEDRAARIAALLDAARARRAGSSPAGSGESSPAT